MAPLLSLTADPLLAFLQKLGLAGSPDMIAEREDLGTVTYSSESGERVKQVTVTSLALDDFLALPNAYGNAVQCEFRLGGASVFQVHAGATQKDLASFHTNVRRANEIDIWLTLDKAVLLAEHLMRQAVALPPRAHPHRPQVQQPAAQLPALPTQPAQSRQSGSPQPGRPALPL